MTNYGTKVNLRLSIKRYSCGTEVLRNVTEIHYNYMNSGRIAFESDIHSSGIVYDISDIVEFDTELESKKAKEF